MTRKYRVQCDVETMARGVPGMTPQEITTIFRDGRAASFLLDQTGAKIFTLEQAPYERAGV